MARFLIDTDYNDTIQTADLAVIAPTSAILWSAELKATDKIRTKTIQRYNMDVELRQMDVYSASAYYRARERVYKFVDSNIYYVKDQSLYSTSKTYAINDIVKDADGYIYTAIAISTNQPLTNTAYWTKLTATAPTNAPNATAYSTATAYVIGNNVYDTNGAVYISIQAGTNKPLTNTAYWTPVTVTVNSTYWVSGDNRYKLLIQIFIDLTLHNLYARINPRNIPDLRIDKYRESIDQLDRWASGTDNAEMVEISTEDKTGYSIVYGGSQVKQDNFF